MTSLKFDIDDGIVCKNSEKSGMVVKARKRGALENATNPQTE
jgi:hypothetical protein